MWPRRYLQAGIFLLLAVILLASYLWDGWQRAMEGFVCGGNIPFTPVAALPGQKLSSTNTIDYSSIGSPTMPPAVPGVVYTRDTAIVVAPDAVLAGKCRKNVISNTSAIWNCDNETYAATLRAGPTQVAGEPPRTYVRQTDTVCTPEYDGSPNMYCMDSRTLPGTSNGRNNLFATKKAMCDDLISVYNNIMKGLTTADSVLATARSAVETITLARDNIDSVISTRGCGGTQPPAMCSTLTSIRADIIADLTTVNAILTRLSSGNTGATPTPMTYAAALEMKTTFRQILAGFNCPYEKLSS